MKTVEEFNSKIKRVLVSEEEIKEAIARVGKEISDSYDGRPILLVSILKGAFVFMADLCRAITVPCEIGFMAAKSYYEGTESSGNVKITLDLSQDISKYHVIIVEDIIDTGRTLNDIIKLLKDCMTRCRFWHDDAQVCVECVSKMWTRYKAGINILVEQIEADNA